MQLALKRAIIESPYTYEELAHEVSSILGQVVSYDILNNMANGRKKTQEKIVKAVGKVLGLPSYWPNTEQPFSVNGIPLAPIQVVGNVSAGSGAYTIDPDRREIFVPETLASIGGLGWVIEGDSMMPDLEEGMVAIFREHRTPRSGMTFLIKDPNEGGLRVKTLDWRKDGWTMVSANSNYAPEILSGHELLGFLIGWYRVRGKRETMDSDPDGLMLRSW